MPTDQNQRRRDRTAPSPTIAAIRNCCLFLANSCLFLIFSPLNSTNVNNTRLNYAILFVRGFRCKCCSVVSYRVETMTVAKAVVRLVERIIVSRRYGRWQPLWMLNTKKTDEKQNWTMWEGTYRAFAGKSFAHFVVQVFLFFEPLTYDLHRDSLGVFLFSLERAFCFLRNLILAVNKLLLRVEQKCITASSVRPDLWYFDISIECVCVYFLSVCVSLEWVLKQNGTTYGFYVTSHVDKDVLTKIIDLFCLISKILIYVVFDV